MRAEITDRVRAAFGKRRDPPRGRSDSVGNGFASGAATHHEDMVIEQRSTSSRRFSSSAAVRLGRPHWGYLSRSVSRYGVISSTLVIYAPDASERERRWAEISRAYGVVAFGAGLLVWIGSAAAGIPPLPALLAIAVVTVPVGVALSRLSRPVRQNAATVVSCCSGLLPDDEGRDAQRRLDALADSMQAASAAYRSGELDPRSFTRVWRAAYDHARS